jgi:diaminohydroxyphosphoribosylaminopyrimidine deaminase/5-amino-6-(5-phosphoribosylamino)uracil reductase
LTRRLGRNRATDHWRIVLDGRLRVAESARVFRGPGRRVVVTAARPSHPRARRLASRGVEVWSLPGRSPGRVDLPRLLAELGARTVTGLMVEGGAETLWSFFSAGLVDRAAVFLAPRVLGGRSAPGGVAGEGFALSKAPRLTAVRVEALGGDLLVTGRLA